MKSAAACLLVYAAVAWVFAAHGRPNIDEGMFLTAAQRVAEGELPYRDFPFSQAPLLPWAYAAAPRWDGSALLGGRLLSLGYGLAGMAAALWLARRVAGPLAALFTLLLTLGALPLLWVANTVRAQSVATPLLLVAAASLALPLRGLGWALPASLALWSSGLRLTHLAVFALLAAWAAWRLRAEPARLARAAALLGAQALLVFAPALRAPGDAWFHVIRAQLERGERIGYVMELSPLEEAGRRIGLYTDLLADGWLLLGAAAIAAWLWLRAARERGRPDPERPAGDWRSASLALFLLAAASLAPHLVFANAFPEYLVAFWALLAPAAAIVLAAALARVARPALSAAVALALAAAVAGNAAAFWPVFVGSGASSFASFRSTAAALGARAGEGCTALSFETHLVVESGCRVLPGLEYSLYSYFPGLDAETARARGVLTPELLRERVAERPPDWIALAPFHPRVLAGARIEQRGDRLLVPQVAPLAFLGPHAARYRQRRTIEVPSGLWREGERDTVPLRVYERFFKRYPDPDGPLPPAHPSL